MQYFRITDVQQTEKTTGPDWSRAYCSGKDDPGIWN